MKKNNIEPKTTIHIIGAAILFTTILIIFGISNSYATESAFGTISIECNSNTIARGNKAICIIKGNVPVNSEVSCLSLEIVLDDNLTLTKFTNAGNWIGSIDDDGNNSDEPIGEKIYLYSDENSSGTFDIGTIEVTASNDAEEDTATINLVNVYFYDENYNEKEINDTNYNLQIVSDYLEFDNSLTIDENNKIINNIKGNTTIQNIINKIDTNGNITILDKNNNLVSNYSNLIGTGYKIRILLANKTYEYKVSVKGDVTGAGKPTMGSAMKIAKYIIGDETLGEQEYFNAADVTGDGQVKMNDVMKIAKSIVDNIEL